VLAQRATYVLLFAQALDEVDLFLGVRIELVDADHGLDPGFLNIVDMMEQVAAAFFEQAEVLFGVLRRQRFPRYDRRAAAVHLQGADCGHEYGDVGLEAGQTAFDIPEFLKSDVSGEAGLGHVIIEELETDAVADDRALADCDVRERTGVHETGLVLDCIAKGRVDRVAHKGGHSAVHFQIGSRYRIALLAIGDDNFTDPLPQILQVSRDRQDRHQLATDGYAELGIHLEAVLAALAPADADVAEPLGAEVYYPAHLYAFRVDIQALQPDLFEAIIAIIALMLHTRIEGDHGEVMGVHNIVDVAGQPKRKLGHRDQKRIAAARRSALDIHGRSTGRLA